MPGGLLGHGGTMAINQTRPDPVLSWLSGSALRAEASRITAAAAVDAEELTAAPGRGLWDRARTVLLDADSARACVDAGLPRRPGVMLLLDGSGGSPDESPGTPQDWRLAVRLGAEQVLVLPDDAAQLVQQLGCPRLPKTSAAGGVVAVVGGKGGVGASVLAAAVAMRAHQAALLVDLDGAGPGLDLMLGLEHAAGLRWPDLRLQGGRVSAAALTRALPAKGEVSVLSGRREPVVPDESAVRAVLEAGRDGGLVVVCDVARSAGPAAELALGLADLVVLVVTADVAACAAGARTAARILPHNPNSCLVVRGPAPGGLRAADIAEAVGLPLVFSMRPEPGLARRLEHSGLALGRRSPLAMAAAAVLRVHRLRPDHAA